MRAAKPRGGTKRRSDKRWVGHHFTLPSNTSDDLHHTKTQQRSGCTTTRPVDQSYGRTVSTLDDAIALVGPGTGISTSLGLLGERGPALAQALVKESFHARRVDQSLSSRRGSIRVPCSWMG